MRVQIPAYTDAWMKGDRWGDVVGRRIRHPKDGSPSTEIAAVRLDKSGKIVSVVLDDCTVVDVEPRL